MQVDVHQSATVRFGSPSARQSLYVMPLGRPRLILRFARIVPPCSQDGTVRFLGTTDDLPTDSWACFDWKIGLVTIAWHSRGRRKWPRVKCASSLEGEFPRRECLRLIPLGLAHPARGLAAALSLRGLRCQHSGKI